jgi:hypothetical protein
MRTIPNAPHGTKAARRRWAKEKKLGRKARTKDLRRRGLTRRDFGRIGAGHAEAE